MTKFPLWATALTITTAVLAAIAARYAKIHGVGYVAVVGTSLLSGGAWAAILHYASGTLITSSVTYDVLYALTFYAVCVIYGDHPVTASQLTGIVVAMVGVCLVHAD